MLPTRSPTSRGWQRAVILYHALRKRAGTAVMLMRNSRNGIPTRWRASSAEQLRGCDYAPRFSSRRNWRSRTKNSAPHSLSAEVLLNALWELLLKHRDSTYLTHPMIVALPKRAPEPKRMPPRIRIARSYHLRGSLGFGQIPLRRKYRDINRYTTTRIHIPIGDSRNSITPPMISDRAQLA